MGVWLIMLGRGCRSIIDDLWFGTGELLGWLEVGCWDRRGVKDGEMLKLEA